MTETEQEAIQVLELCETLALKAITMAIPENNQELAKVILKKIAYKIAFDVDYQTIQQLNKK
jgi:hypothetical protein